jgi:hypothetical protein
MMKHVFSCVLEQLEWRLFPAARIAMTAYDRKLPLTKSSTVASIE